VLKPRLRRVLGEPQPQVLSREAGPSVVGAWHVLPFDADRLLRGDPQRMRHRLACGGFAVLAAASADRTGRADAGPRIDLTNAAADGRSRAPGSVRLGAAASDAGGFTELKRKPSASTR